MEHEQEEYWCPNCKVYHVVPICYQTLSATSLKKNPSPDWNELESAQQALQQLRQWDQLNPANGDSNPDLPWVKDTLEKVSEELGKLKLIVRNLQRESTALKRAAGPRCCDSDPEETPVCDFCFFFDFNADEKGRYDGNGVCWHPDHPKTQDPMGGCSDFHCRLRMPSGKSTLEAAEDEFNSTIVVLKKQKNQEDSTA